MKYNKLEELKKLQKTNENLINFIKSYPKESLTLTAIGNSISNGFSITEPGKLLLDRNLNLIEIGKKQGLNVQKYHLCRSENNNSLAVANWILSNCTEQDTYNWNIADYKRAIELQKPLLSEEQIKNYFSNGSNKKIQDIILNSDPKEANIIILNLGTGSFLDILTRHGSLTIPNIFYSLQRDITGIAEILELIQNNNRQNNAHTQVYLCGAPKILNTVITDLAMNPGIRKIGSDYANVVYVPSFPRQAFYKTSNGTILVDPHYNHAEYYHLLNEVETHIINSYLIKDLLIDMDTILYKLSVENDISGAKNNISDALDVIENIAKKYKEKDGNYNYFLDLAKTYIKRRYPFDFYRLSSKQNLSRKIDSLKIK